MDKDEQGNWINPYHYINYKNQIKHEGEEDINKQDRWSEQDKWQPNEPNDNTVEENLIALDTAIYELSKMIGLPDLDRKANVELDNITIEGEGVINRNALKSFEVVSEEGSSISVEPIITRDPNTGLYFISYVISGGGGGGDTKEWAEQDASNIGNNDTIHTSNINDWASALCINYGKWTEYAGQHGGLDIKLPNPGSLPPNWMAALVDATFLYDQLYDEIETSPVSIISKDKNIARNLVIIDGELSSINFSISALKDTIGNWSDPRQNKDDDISTYLADLEARVATLETAVSPQQGNS